MNSLDIVKKHIIKTLTSYDLSRKNKSLRAELGKIHTLADKLSKNNDWICVDDELLKQYANKEILIYTAWGNIKKAIYSLDNSPYIDDNGKEYQYSHWFSDEFGDFMWEFDEVKYWQPLPKDPEE